MKKKNNTNLKAVMYVWGLICSMSSIDQQKNNISLFNVIDQINIKKDLFQKGSPITVNIPHEIVIVLRRSVGQELCTDKIVVETKLSLLDPTGKILNESSVPIPFDTGKRIMRFRIQLPAFNVSVPGDYGYNIQLLQPGKTEMEDTSWIPFEVRAI